MTMGLANILGKDLLMASIPVAPKPKKHHGQTWWHTHWYDDGSISHGGRFKRRRRDKWFGKCAQVTERQARAAFNIWLTRWHTEDRIKNPGATQHTYAVAELATDYLAHARRTFIKHGKMTSHVWEVAYGMQALMDYFAGRGASSIEAPELAGLRDAMIRDESGAVRSIRTVNGRLLVIKEAFRWAREKGLVTREAVADLDIVKPLIAGRCAAKSPAPILPVDEHWMAIVKDHCASPVKAMIDLQWLTGMRPGEACVARACDIDMSGDVWLFEPHIHKMEHKALRRIIPLGPLAQRVIRPFLARATEAYLFSPAESRAEQLENRRKDRKTAAGRGNFPGSNVKTRPARSAGALYSEQSYRKAIHYACDRAFPFPGHLTAKQLEKLAPAEKQKYAADLLAWRQEHKWNPNQLRHAAATRFNKMFGLEDVSVTLGHQDLATTRIYALPDVSKAVELARKVG